MSHQEAERTEQYHLRIADWTLLEDRHCLLRNNETKRLEPRTIQLLGYMARHVGEPLSRESLLREVWQGVVVNDETLTTTINKIRRAFGDSSQNPKVIETFVSRKLGKKRPFKTVSLYASGAIQSLLEMLIFGPINDAIAIGTGHQ